VELGTLVPRVRDAERFTFADRGGGLPDQDSVHDDPVTPTKVLQREFVFGRDCGLDRAGLTVENNLVTRLQTHQGDCYVVGGADS
jgi:hypothetical protein